MAASILLIGSLVAPTLSLPRAANVNPKLLESAMLNLAQMPGHKAQGPILALAYAAGYDAAPLPPPRPISLGQALLDLYVSAGIRLTPELVSSIDQSSATMTPQVARVYAPLVESVAVANILANDAAHKHPVDHAEMLAAELTMASASEFVMVNQASVPWPAGGYQDPLGLTRLGTPGNDIYYPYYFLTLDPGGNDTYDNNAGATNPFFYPPLTDRAALMLQLSGNTTYSVCDGHGAPACFGSFCYNYCYTQGLHLGSADTGAGLAIDEGGNASIWLDGGSGAGSGYDSGIGVDLQLGSHNEVLGMGENSVGVGIGGGWGLFYTPGGHDVYNLSLTNLGAGFAQGVGVFLDTGGWNDYSGTYGGLSPGNFGAPGCQSISVFLDTGTGPDRYPLLGPGANDASWGGYDYHCPVSGGYPDGVGVAGDISLT
ncbi:MAG: hypothetical protein ACYDDF_03550 [Thermoplasmatota archaeon]